MPHKLAPVCSCPPCLQASMERKRAEAITRYHALEATRSRTPSPRSARPASAQQHHTRGFVPQGMRQAAAAAKRRPQSAQPLSRPTPAASSGAPPLGVPQPLRMPRPGSAHKAEPAGRGSVQSNVPQKPHRLSAVGGASACLASPAFCLACTAWRHSTAEEENMFKT